MRVTCHRVQSIVRRNFRNGPSFSLCHPGQIYPRTAIFLLPPRRLQPCSRDTGRALVSPLNGQHVLDTRFASSFIINGNNFGRLSKVVR